MVRERAIRSSFIPTPTGCLWRLQPRYPESDTDLNVVGLIKHSDQSLIGYSLANDFVSIVLNFSGMSAE